VAIAHAVTLAYFVLLLYTMPVKKITMRKKRINKTTRKKNNRIRRSKKTGGNPPTKRSPPGPLTGESPLKRARTDKSGSPVSPSHTKEASASASAALPQSISHHRNTATTAATNAALIWPPAALPK